MISPKLLLSTSLKHVGRHGWTKDALAAGSVELGLSPVSHGLVDKGAAALVAEHQRQANEAFVHELEDYMSTPGLKASRDIVEFGIWSRLQKTFPVQSTWAQAMAIGARPENISNTIKHLTDVADAIASRLDDRQDSYEWYTNRAAITAAYCACELYMISDYSENFENTRRFVHNRVVNEGSRVIQTFNGLGDVANTLVSGAATSANVGIKMGFDAIKFLIPAQAGTALINPLLDMIAKQAGIASPQSQSQNHERDEDKYEDESLIEAKLPEGTSLFGMVSKDVKETSDLLRQMNPDFTIIVWPMWESLPSQPKHTDPRRVIRLIHDKQNIVIDVLRM